MATMKNWTGVEGQGSRTVQQFTTFQWIEIGHLSFCSVSTCMFLYLTKSLLIYSLFLWLTLLNPWLWLNMPHLMASNRNLSVVCRSVLPPRTDSDSCWNLYVVRRLICSSTHFYIHLIYTKHVVLISNRRLDYVVGLPSLAPSIISNSYCHIHWFYLFAVFRCYHHCHFCDWRDKILRDPTNGVWQGLPDFQESADRCSVNHWILLFFTK